MRQTYLTIHDLSIGIPSGALLAEGIQARVPVGGALLISGANGSGKSTLLRVLLGKQRARRGKVEWNLGRGSIGYLPQVQDSEVHLPLTIENILDGARGLEFGLLQRRHLRLAWNSASGGEKKRTLITRLFLDTPDIVVLDEPLNHLDHESRQMIVGALREYISEPDTQRIAIVVSHEELLEEGLRGLPLAHIHL